MRPGMGIDSGGLERPNWALEMLRNALIILALTETHIPDARNTIASFCL